MSTYSKTDYYSQESTGQRPNTQASDIPTAQRPKTSWIWMFASLNSLGNVDKDGYGQKCWRCCFCPKTYKESSGTLKPMQHLKKEHSVEKPTDVCKCESNSSLLGKLKYLY
jgi:hypothetical protein